MPGGTGQTRRANVDIKEACQSGDGIRFWFHIVPKVQWS
jgi:hypothetical protein